MEAPWIHILYDVRSLHQLEDFVGTQFPKVALKPLIDGRETTSLARFYEEVFKAAPLVNQFGANPDALIDLIRTFGWGGYAGKQHVLSWFQPEAFLTREPLAFEMVLDIIVGVSKELLVGEELDPTFDPNDERDWVSTRLDVVFACNREVDAIAISELAQNLSDTWRDEFKSLEIPIEMMRSPRLRSE